MRRFQQVGVIILFDNHIVSAIMICWIDLCKTLQHSATHCETLQHPERHCNTLKLTLHRWRMNAECCRVLHSVAWMVSGWRHCDVLQVVAECFSHGAVPRESYRTFCDIINMWENKTNIKKGNTQQALF